MDKDDNKGKNNNSNDNGNDGKGNNNDGGNGNSGGGSVFARDGQGNNRLVVVLCFTLVVWRLHTMEII
jgi:hypothetical protein